MWLLDHDITVDASTNTLGAVTVDASKTLTVATGQTITAGGHFRYKRNLSYQVRVFTMPTAHLMQLEVMLRIVDRVDYS